jgi:hypothetical protein
MFQDTGLQKSRIQDTDLTGGERHPEKSVGIV